jgi:hypothetical protein
MISTSSPWPRLALALAIIASCRGRRQALTASQVATAVTAVLGAADHTRAPWRCTAGDLPAVPDQQLPGGWKLHGHTLAFATADPTAATTLAVIADAGGAAPPTVAALGALRAKLAEARPALVVALGGMGTTQPELEATLGALADVRSADVPVLVLPGDLEAMPAYAGALAALRARGSSLIDGRLVRWVELPAATIATVPGAGATARLVSGVDGCAWTSAEVSAIYAELAAHPGVRIAASSEAPRTTSGEASGELALVPTAAQVDIAVHGPTSPAPTPARSGTRDGRAAALTPGTADATTRLPDPHVPSAGLLVVRSNSWSWRPVF